MDANEVEGIERSSAGVNEGMLGIELLTGGRAKVIINKFQIGVECVLGLSLLQS